MEASSISPTAGFGRSARTAVGPLLRLRSDEQLVKLFRQGNDDAFRVIYDRYRARIFAYTRQMLAGSRQDAEDALQDVFVRAYGALRSSDRDISLRAWLYRVAHNRCIDELRRPLPPAPELLEQFQPPRHDPIAEIERRESLRRLVADVRRLPEQQRSALLMREIDGMTYQELASALDVTVPAVKSLLVRARMGLAAAAEAREAACDEIRVELADAHDRGVRASGRARRHLRDCSGCRSYRRELRSLRERFAALTPAVGPLAVLLKLLGGGTAAGGGGAAAGGVAAGGAAVGYAAGVGGTVSAGQVAAVVAAAVVGAGGAVEVKRNLVPPPETTRPAAVVRAAVAHAPASIPAAATEAAPAVVRPTAAGAAPAAASPATPRARRRPARADERHAVPPAAAVPVQPSEPVAPAAGVELAADGPAATHPAEATAPAGDDAAVPPQPSGATEVPTGAAPPATTPTPTKDGVPDPTGTSATTGASPRPPADAPSAPVAPRAGGPAAPGHGGPPAATR